MTSLAAEFKQLLTGRIERASPAEIMAIANTLCVEDQPLIFAPATQRFTLIGDDQVLDATTDLIWTRAVLPGGRRTWKDSLQACTDFQCGGHKWRASTIHERLSIVDYERHAPALDPIFTSDKEGWEWTSTPAACSPGDYAWNVNFNFGYSNWSNQDDTSFVRAVRPRQ